MLYTDCHCIILLYWGLSVVVTIVCMLSMLWSFEHRILLICYLAKWHGAHIYRVFPRISHKILGIFLPWKLGVDLYAGLKISSQLSPIAIVVYISWWKKSMQRRRRPCANNTWCYYLHHLQSRSRIVHKMSCFRSLGCWCVSTTSHFQRLVTCFRCNWLYKYTYLLLCEIWYVHND